MFKERNIEKLKIMWISRQNKVIIPRNHWIDGYSKVVLHHVEIGVANPRIEYVECDIIITICPV